MANLEPAYYEAIHRRLVAKGGSDTSTEIAAGVAAAVYKFSLSFLQDTGDRRGVREFRGLFETRDAADRTSADAMIDYIVTRAPGMDAQGMFLHTLIKRLDQVLSRPANA